MLITISLVFSGSLISQNHLLHYEIVDTFSLKFLEEKWSERKMPKFIAPLNYGVDVYEIIYNGSSTAKSGETLST